MRKEAEAKAASDKAKAERKARKAVEHQARLDEAAKQKQTRLAEKAFNELMREAPTSPGGRRARNATSWFERHLSTTNNT